MKKFIVSFIILVLSVSLLLFNVSAESIISNDGLSYMMAFAGSANTGLNYLSSGFIEYNINDSYVLESASSVGTFTSDSFLSSVYYLKNTDGTYILHKGDSFKYSFNNFSFVIKSSSNSYSASQIEANVIFTYDDDTTLVVQPDFDFNTSSSTIELFGKAEVTKNVKDIKLDCKFYPSTVGLTGYLGYYYYMYYPPDVYIEIDSSDSQILGDINDNLNNAINGEVEPDKSPVDDSLNDMLDKEDELFNSTESGRESILTYIGEAIAGVALYATSFLAVSSVIDIFFSLPMLSTLVVVSLGLGIFALIVNLGQAIDRADRAKESRKRKGTKGG